MDQQLAYRLGVEMVHFCKFCQHSDKLCHRCIIQAGDLSDLLHQGLREHHHLRQLLRRLLGPRLSLEELVVLSQGPGNKTLTVSSKQSTVPLSKSSHPPPL